MKFIVFVKANADSEAGVMPTEEMLMEMGKFNEELFKAGMMLDASGLHPSSKGTRITFHDRKPTVVNGPFPNPEELVAGFWILKAKSRDEVVDWLSRAPFDGGTIEIRQLFDMEDFVQGEAIDRAKELGQKLQKQKAEA